MKNVLLTGSSGLLGRAIQREYKQYKYEIFNLIPVSSKDLDLLTYEAINNFIKEYNIDCIIHCAARCVGLQQNVSNPLSILFDNIQMDKNIIECALNNNVQELLYMGSSSVYPASEHTAKESDMFNGLPAKENEGYAYSKILAGKMCQIASEKSKVNYKTLVLPNMYGIEHKYEGTNQHLTTAVVNKVIEAIKNNQDTIEIWGDGQNKRELLCVDDLAEYIVYIINNDMIDILPPYLNTGSNQAYSINEYYRITAEIFGYTGNFVHNLDKPSGAKLRLMDSSLAINEYDWTPSTSLREGLNIIKDYFME